MRYQNVRSNVIKLVLSGFSLKLGAAIAAFFLVGITSNVLGPVGRGNISLLITTIVLANLFNSIVGGVAMLPAIKSASSKGDLLQKIVISYLWAFIVNLLSALSVSIIFTFDSELFLWTVLLGLIFSITSINSLFLINLNKINLYMSINFWQNVICLLTFCIVLLCFPKYIVNSFNLCLLIAYASCLILTIQSVMQTYRSLDTNMEFYKDKNSIVSLISSGVYAQAGNILLFLVYRIHFYLIGIYFGEGVLGVYSVSISLMEALWMISGSIAVVMFARISKNGCDEHTAKYVLICAKSSFILTMLCLIFILSLPAEAYVLIFGNGFDGIKNVMITIALGSLATSISTIFHHYFTATEEYGVILRISAISFFISLIGGGVFIPSGGGLFAAGVTSSVANVAMMTGYAYHFCRRTGLRPSALVISADDVHQFVAMVRSLMRSNAHD